MSDRIKLSSGREFYANHGIVGISLTDALDPDGWDVHQGYDGTVFMDADPGNDTFTLAERRELAERMISRWREWGGL